MAISKSLKVEQTSTGTGLCEHHVGTPTWKAELKKPVCTNGKIIQIA